MTNPGASLVAKSRTQGHRLISISVSATSSSLVNKSEIEPPFVLLMSSLPPLAPAAWGCTLM